MRRCFLPLAWVLASTATAKSSIPKCCKDNMTYVDDSVTSALPNGAFVVAARHCQRICAANPSCVSFTWKEHGSPAGVSPAVPSGGCYLFSAEKKLRAEAGSVSGPKRCKGPRHFRLPFNVSFELPDTWIPEGSGKRKEKKPKEKGPSMTQQMKAKLKDWQHQVSNLEVCSGPRCCEGSTCHYTSGCDERRGTTKCVGAGLVPFKWGKCECVSGACSSRDGRCADAPEGGLQQAFDMSSGEAQAAQVVANGQQRNWDPSAAFLGATTVLLVAGLVAGVRSLRRGAELEQQVALRENFECELAE